MKLTGISGHSGILGSSKQAETRGKCSRSHCRLPVMAYPRSQWANSRTESVSISGFSDSAAITLLSSNSRKLEQMEITAEQYEKIKESLPVQRGNVRLSNLTVLNALLYVAEHGCKWRGLPKHFGNWHSIYVRMNRWAKNGVLDQVFEKLQLEQIVRIKIEAFSLDSAIVQVHPDDLGALEKADPKPSASPAAEGPPRFIWLPRMLERP